MAWQALGKPQRFSHALLGIIGRSLLTSYRDIRFRECFPYFPPTFWHCFARLLNPFWWTNCLSLTYRMSPFSSLARLLAFTVLLTCSLATSVPETKRGPVCKEVVIPVTVTANNRVCHFSLLISKSFPHPIAMSPIPFSSNRTRQY